MAEAPRAPFSTWPTEFVDPRFGFAWYRGRGLIVTQATISRGTEATAHAYHDYESSVLRKHGDEIRECGGLFVIHDWRTLTDHSPETRRVWQERMKARPRGYLRGSVVCLAKASAFLRMQVQAVSLFSSITLGATIELSTDIEAALREHGVSVRGGTPRSG